MTNCPIPNDDLGDWGEAQFRALCSGASLVASKAERDKMGWDFIVELPPEATTAKLPLDQRPNRLGCRIQVKTHWEREDDRFGMTLSSAQRLALDPGPSFVLVLIARAPTADEDPTLVSCSLIHMLNDNLERVLKRLRESEINPQAKSLDKQSISYKGSSGESLLPKGKALRDALIRLCGADAQSYIATKASQLRELGYKAGKYRLNTTITADSPDEFVEMMLGLRPVKIDKLETFDVRFDLPVPINQVPPEATHRMEIEPHPFAKCTLRIRGAGLTPPAVFQGDVILPAYPIPIQHMRMLVKAPFLTLDIKERGNISFKLDGDLLMKAELSLATWQNYLRLLTILSEPKLELDIEADGTSMPRSNFTLNSPSPTPKEPWFACLGNVARRGEALLKFAGAMGEKIILEKLSETADMIDRAYARLFEPASVSKQTFETAGELPIGIAVTDIELLQADYVVVAGVTLAYACRVTMRSEPNDDKLLWQEIDSRPEKLTVIDGSIAAFKSFVADCQSSLSLQNTMIRELETS